ncbi:energy transducer TonB [Mesorhizobium hawassense]|uniref:Protein TonB n=1 Tax=Mesorhizobium hawassense TaxID=1209954 RepID=A0A330HES6_9HYPH|nr:energy transducer TonB [Mesorhizobium hawassense]RAZ87226.1 energy transducer TonB [Mesorhizobium hawassense]
MTLAVLSRISQPRLGLREAGLWTSAAAIILAAHVAVAYAVQDLSFAEIPDGGPPPAPAVEMAPLVIAPAVPEETAMLDTVTPEPADAAEMTEKPAEVKPVTDPSPEQLVEQAEPVAEPPTDADKAQEAEPAEQTMAALSDQPPLEEVVPDPAEAIAPDVVIPLPKPKPVEAEVKTPKPVEAKKRKAEKKPLEKPKERPKKEKAPPPKTTITASIDAKAAAKAAAPQSTANVARRSSVSPSRWNSSLAAWIRRHTRYPSPARSRRAEGTPSVTFTVDTSGRVVSARLARSSGDGDLDRAALAALQGASVPAPPAELGAHVTRTAPFVFSLRD